MDSVLSLFFQGRLKSLNFCGVPGTRISRMSEFCEFKKVFSRNSPFRAIRVKIFLTLEKPCLFYKGHLTVLIQRGILVSEGRYK